MNPRISNVFPTNDYKLILVFTNGERRIYDCSGLLNFGVFNELKNLGYFKQVKVQSGTFDLQADAFDLQEDTFDWRADASDLSGTFYASPD